MTFLETSVFTRQITELIEDDSYAELQQLLIIDPEAGALIRGSGGLRKIRWNLKGKGKSGGIRIIYYLVDSEEIFMLFAHKKSKQEVLSDEQMRTLRRLVEKHLKK